MDTQSKPDERERDDMLRDDVQNLSELEGLTFIDIDAAQGFLDAMRYPPAPEWLDPGCIRRGGVDSTDIRAHRYADAAEPVVLLPHTLDWNAYGRDAVSESNFRALAAEMESREENGEAEPLVPVSYWNTTGLAVRLTLLTEDVAYELARLADYPVLDDDLLYEVEQEIIEEAWESCGRDDLKAGLADALGLESRHELPESLGDDELDLAWLGVMNDQGIHPELDGVYVYWRGMYSRGTMLALIERLQLDPDTVALAMTEKIIPDHTFTIIHTETVTYSRDVSMDEMRRLLSLGGHRMEEFAEFHKHGDGDEADFYTFNEQALAEAVLEVLEHAPEWLERHSDVEGSEFRVEFF